MYTDSHVHLYDAYRRTGELPSLSGDMLVCASAHDKDEFLWQEAFARSNPGRVLLSFGIHPQKPEQAELPFLEELVRSRRIRAIGECGFDLFDDTFRKTAKKQAEVWETQLEFALQADLPLIVHARKAMHLVFAATGRLKKARAVVFHGWPGSAAEAESFLKRGVNAWFSAGKGLLRGDRSLVETVKNLPATRLLSETDAPYMQCKGELFSVPGDIRTVVAAFARIRECGEAELAGILSRSFREVFGDCP